jgi:hypothetical protein
MDAWVWVVIAVVVIALVIVAALAWAAQQRRRHSDRLRDRFGSEYDRVVAGESTKERRAGEDELSRREMRRDHLDIRPLSTQTRERFSTAWAEVQRDFVDHPEQSVGQAENLVVQLMGERGYPVNDDFENQASLVSVDHPGVVENYRQAHAVYERSRRHEADTEQLRGSLVYYRSLFDELLTDSGART